VLRGVLQPPRGRGVDDVEAGEREVDVGLGRVADVRLHGVDQRADVVVDARLLGGDRLGRNDLGGMRHLVGDGLRTDAEARQHPCGGGLHHRLGAHAGALSHVVIEQRAQLVVGHVVAEVERGHAVELVHRRPSWQ